MKKHRKSALMGKQPMAILLSMLLLFASLPIAAMAEDGLPQEEDGLPQEEGGAPQIYDDIASAEAAEGEVMEVVHSAASWRPSALAVSLLTL